MRLVESALTRVVFIKTGPSITVREITYIPDVAYARNRGYDISRNSIGNFDAGFSGRIVIRKWNGAEVSRRLIEKGKITRAGRLKKAQDAIPGGSLANRETTNSYECTTYEICEYERFCGYEWQSDGYVERECSPWEATGYCWQEEYCESVPDCTGSAEQCACAMFGDCGGGDEEPEERTCQEKMDDVDASAAELSEKESVEETGGNTETKYKTYKWKVYTVSNGLIPMYLTSVENGVHINPNGYWKFQSLTHHDIVKSGVEILYSVSTEAVNPVIWLSVQSGRPDQVANINLEFTVKISAICDGVPITFTKNPSPSTSWHVSE